MGFEKEVKGVAFSSAEIDDHDVCRRRFRRLDVWEAVWRSEIWGMTD